MVTQNFHYVSRILECVSCPVCARCYQRILHQIKASRKLYFPQPVYVELLRFVLLLLMTAEKKLTHKNAHMLNSLSSVYMCS